MKSTVIYNSREWIAIASDENAYQEHLKSTNQTEEEFTKDMFYEYCCTYYRYDASEAFEGLNVYDGVFIVTGVLGLWDGMHEIHPTIIKSIEMVSRKCMCDDDAVVELVEDDDISLLTITSMHHDGTNRFIVRMLSDKGVEMIEDTPIDDIDFSDHALYKPIEFV